MLCRRRARRAQNPYSIAHAHGSLPAGHLDADSHAYDDGPDVAAAALPADKAAARASCSLASLHVAAVRARAGSRSAVEPALLRASDAVAAPGLGDGCDRRTVSVRSAPADTRARDLLRRHSAPTRQARACVPALDFFSDDLREDVLIERQIGD